jgi:haloalkane dehalogenase
MCAAWDGALPPIWWVWDAQDHRPIALIGSWTTPRLVLRPLNEPEMEAYRRPFPDRESRLPTLVWPRELPIEGEPADVVAIVEDYGQWMATSSVPKLFINAEPGSLLIGRSRDFCRAWPNQDEVSVRGIHFIQEDNPNEIGTALAEFLRSALAR